MNRSAQQAQNKKQKKKQSEFNMFTTMTPATNDTATPEPAFHGAAIIDSHGKEVPITEAMVQQALEQLSITRLDKMPYC